MAGLVYIDSSALLKLVATEVETPALTSWLDGRHGDLVSSDLVRTEVLRAARRRDSEVQAAARRRLEAVTTLAVSREVCDLAAGLGPTILRSLDAIHVATALTLGDELDAVVTYDRRMAEAVNIVGLTTVAPGAEASG